MQKSRWTEDARLVARRYVLSSPRAQASGYLHSHYLTLSTS